jgi:lipid A 4'-phosphatase
MVMKRTIAKLIAAIRRPAFWIPAVLLAAATLVFRFTDLDLVLMRPFFSGYVVPHDGGLAEFLLQHQQPWRALNDWGEYPAWILGGGGVVVCLASFAWKRLRPWRDAGLCFVLLLVLGPGLLVNCAFKPFWNRPRPQATIAFGVERPFLHVFERGYSDGDSSFPSGHAAMGFYLMAPAFVCWRRWPWLAVVFLLVGLGSGTVVGLARMVAGRHFPSDVLWAGAIVYFTALLLAACFRFGTNAADCDSGPIGSSL